MALSVVKRCRCSGFAEVIGALLPRASWLDSCRGSTPAWSGGLATLPVADQGGKAEILFLGKSADSLSCSGARQEGDVMNFSLGGKKHDPTLGCLPQKMNFAWMVAGPAVLMSQMETGTEGHSPQMQPDRRRRSLHLKQ